MLARTYPVSGPLDLRRTLGPLSRGPGDPTIRSRHRTRLVGDQDAPTGRPRSRSSMRATSSRARPGARAPNGRWRTCPAMLGARVAPAAHPGRPPARRLTWPGASRRPDPALAAPSSSRSSRRSSSRRSPARRRGGRGSGSSGPRRAGARARPNGGSGSARRRPPSPRSPTTPITRSASSSGGPSSSGGWTARAAWFEAIVDLPLAEA